MIRINKILFELLPDEFIDNTPLGTLNNPSRQVIKINSFILSFFNNYRDWDIIIETVDGSIIETNTQVLHIKDNLLYFNYKEKSVCNSTDSFITPDFNSLDIGLEDIDIYRILSLDIEGVKWYRN